MIIHRLNAASEVLGVAVRLEPCPVTRFASPAAAERNGQIALAYQPSAPASWLAQEHGLSPGHICGQGE